jgi:hypothetical protein
MIIQDRGSEDGIWKAYPTTQRVSPFVRAFNYNYNFIYIIIIIIIIIKSKGLVLKNQVIKLYGERC